MKKQSKSKSNCGDKTDSHKCTCSGQGEHESAAAPEWAEKLREHVEITIRHVSPREYSAPGQIFMFQYDNLI